MKVIEFKKENRNKKACLLELLKLIEDSDEIESFAICMESNKDGWSIGRCNTNHSTIGALEILKTTLIQDILDEG